jgi:glycosyltransferase involved in cell wall biosynthesis
MMHDDPTRIAIVQHGDYREARRIIGSGQPEPYFGMAYTLTVLDRLVEGRPHLLISLDAPPYREPAGAGELVGLPTPRLPRLVPGSVKTLLHVRSIRKLLKRFRPTHLLLRTGGLLGCGILGFATRHQVSTLAVFAAFFSRTGLHDRLVTDRLIRRLNQPAVFLAGNHRSPATQTMIECGLVPRKAMAWDWPAARHPRDYPVKTLPPAPWEIVYAGSVTEAKGVGDVLAAVALLSEQAAPVRLTIAGDGDAMPSLRKRAAALPAGVATFTGRVGNAEVFDLMRRSALVVVPSRHEFTEGFPLTLTEALASRTPVIVSDHPVFVRALRDGVGVRLFRAADPRGLADMLRSVLDDAAGYGRLSEQTAAAYAALECPVAFGDLIDRWEATFTRKI